MFLQWPIDFLAIDAHAMEANVARLQSILPDVNIHRCTTQPCSTLVLSVAFSSVYLSQVGAVCLKWQCMPS